MLMLCITGGFVYASGASAQVGNPDVFDAHAHLIHMWRWDPEGPPGCPDFRIANGNPLDLEKILIRFPRLRIVVQQAAAPFGRELVLLMLRYPNVYADISGLLFVMGVGPLKPLPESYFAELAPMHSRLLFGSDNPYMVQNAIALLNQVPVDLRPGAPVHCLGPISRARAAASRRRSCFRTRSAMTSGQPAAPRSSVRRLTGPLPGATLAKFPNGVWISYPRLTGSRRSFPPCAVERLRVS
jgi:hypothetical protein